MSMHPHLELLLQIQDLKSQRRELVEYEPDRDLQAREFHIDPDEAIRQLDLRIDELRAELPPPIQSRLDRFSRGAGRAVVPVIAGVCYGCFMAVPTAAMDQLGRNDAVNHCDHCGRFLYVVHG